MTNIVLICTDQWRGDCFSGLGHPHVRTPNLDVLGEHGTVATRAYSPAPTCVPARMSLLTGLDPKSHRRIGYEDGVPFDIETTMAGCFSQAGFQTQAIGKMHVYPERNRAGFDNVILHDGYLHFARRGRPDPRFNDDYTVWLRQQPGNGAFDDEFNNAVHCNEVAARPWDRPEYQHPTNWATTEAINWLYRRDPDQPFFLYLSYHRPHAPYNPPQWAFDMYKDQDLRVPDKGNWEDELLAEYRDDLNPQAHVATYPQQVAQRALAGYYGNITHIDAQIERFIEALNDFGLAEDTIICFTSDHGDMMGEHGMWRKAYPYEGSARVPMIFSGPGIQQDVSTELMSLSDLMPTLLDLANVEVPAGLDGISYADMLRGENSEPSREFLHGEHVVFGQSLQWIITASHKYVWWSESGTEQLFNLTSDPDEKNDLLRETGEALLSKLDSASLHACRQHLIDVLDGREEGFVSDGDLVAGRPVTMVLSKR